MFIYVPDAELVLGHEAHGSERGVELPYLAVEVVRRPDVQLLLVGILLVSFKGRGIVFSLMHFLHRAGIEDVAQEMDENEATAAKLRA